MIQDDLIMEKCIKLAKKAKGYVSPNPLVGCVVMKGSDIIGIGYHEVYGGPHAEVNAIELAKRKGYNLKGATLYTNLEPCSHQGKTPPCADLIIQEKIKKVVIGMQDPYEKVNGSGIEKMRQAGITVQAGVLEEECKELNKFFIKYVTKKLPYVTLKIAQSLDGKIALSNKESRWITGERSRKMVHRMRSHYDAVLIGTNTARLDNPSLTVRDVKGRNPFRLILDPDLKLPKTLNVFTDRHKDKTYIIAAEGNEDKVKLPDIKHIFIKLKNGLIDMNALMKKLYKMEIASVMVEGGGEVYSELIKLDILDDMFFFIAPKIIGKGVSGFDSIEISSLEDAKKLHLKYTKKIKEDILNCYVNHPV
jgi:diaminohydroxyphosphoribosylaminopyrimidine deaminase/5-amino-6-(5-phosphoribosylamino)uracil reductase